jgi:hypothetical protein
LEAEGKKMPETSETRTHRKINGFSMVINILCYLQENLWQQNKSRTDNRINQHTELTGDTLKENAKTKAIATWA